MTLTNDNRLVSWVDQGLSKVDSTRRLNEHLLVRLSIEILDILSAESRWIGCNLGKCTLLWHLARILHHARGWNFVAFIYAILLRMGLTMVVVARVA